MAFEHDPKLFAFPAPQLLLFIAVNHVFHDQHFSWTVNKLCSITDARVNISVRVGELAFSPGITIRVSDSGPVMFELEPGRSPAVHCTRLVRPSNLHLWNQRRIARPEVKNNSRLAAMRVL